MFFGDNRHEDGPLAASDLGHLIILPIISMPGIIPFWI
jgi:hypothetical protein